MTSDPQIELRVSRLENDTNSIYDLIAEHTQRFDRVDAALAELRGTQQVHTQRLDMIESRFDRVDGRFDSIEATLAEVVRRLPNSP